MKELLLATVLFLCAVTSAQRSGSHKESDIRLIHRGRPHSWRGRVEVLHGAKWRPVCQDKWTDRETRVLCKQLGLRTRGVTVFGSLYGRGNNSVIPRVYKCRGREQNLTLCKQKQWQGAKRCGPRQQVSVMCKVGRRDPRKLPVRIAGAARRSSSGVVSERVGRVEVRYRGLWGSVCAHNFGSNEASVVCNAVGLTGGRVLKNKKPGRGPVWLSKVKCNGSESSLLQCARRPWGLAGKCTHKDDVFVRCMGPRIVPVTALPKQHKTFTATTKTPLPARKTEAVAAAMIPLSVDRPDGNKTTLGVYDRVTKTTLSKSHKAMHHPGNYSSLLGRSRAMPKSSDILVKEDEIKTETKNPLHEPALKILPDELPREPITALDLAFAIDATGSMSSYIRQAKENIQEITRQISSKAGVNVRLALVEYRDHVPQDMSFVSRQYDFSASVHDMQRWLDDCSANGGGDGPEAVADALNRLLTLSWRPDATKVAILISDAPPHGLDPSGDAFGNGCPEGHDPIIASHGLAEMSIVLYTVGCEPSINRYKEFFAGLAYLTGGQYVPLGDARLLSSVIVGGAEEEISLQQWVPDVDIAVDKLLEGADIAAGMDDMNHDRLIENVYAILKQRGATVKQLQQNNQTLNPASNDSKEYAAMSNMTSARDLYVKKGGRNSGAGRDMSMHGHSYSSFSYSGGMPEMAGRAPGLAEDVVHTAMFRPKMHRPMHRGRMESEEGGGSSPREKSYSAVEADIDPSQVERLIQRALAKRRKAATEGKSTLS